MRKTKMMLLGVLLATAGASWTATAAGIDQYALKEFTADFTQFHIGDTVPAMYLTPEYNIKQWQQLIQCWINNKKAAYTVDVSY